MPFTLKTLNGFTMIHREAACEIPATSPDRRAFVCVYPPLVDKGVIQWRVRKFELPTALVDEYFGEEDLLNSVIIRFGTLDDVERQLTAWDIDPSKFDAPWKCDYPL